MTNPSFQLIVHLAKQRDDDKIKGIYSTFTETEKRNFSNWIEPNMLKGEDQLRLFHILKHYQ